MGKESGWSFERVTDFFSFVGFEVPTAMTMEYAILWNGTLKSPLKMEAESHSETVQFYQEQGITSQKPALFSS